MKKRLLSDCPALRIWLGRGIMTTMLTMLLTVIATLTAEAQNMKVKDFRLLDRDLTANTYGTQRTSRQDGSVAALIKVVTPEKGFAFDGGSYSLVGDIEYHPGEIWVYVPARSQKISISHPRFGLLRDYFYPIPIEPGRTYELVLDPGVGKYATIQSSTPRSTVYLDGDSIGVSPIYNAYILYGPHKLSATNDRIAGEIDINIKNNGIEENENFTIPMTDQSIHYGKIIITTDKDAEILVDGVVKGVGRYEDELLKGNYIVETRKVNCDNRRTLFAVEPQKTNYVDAEAPIPWNGYLQLFTRPGHPQITIDNEPVEFSQRLELPVGIHYINFSQKGYHSQTVEYDIHHNVTIADTVNLRRVLYLKSNSFYFGGAYTVGAFSGATGIVGLTIKNIDLQASYTFGLNKTPETNFYTAADNLYRGCVQYTTNTLSVKLGYQIALVTHFGIVPQLGYSTQTLTASIVDGNEKIGNGASASFAGLGAKLIYTPAQRFCLFAAPEFDVAVSKDKTIDLIADAAGFSVGGFYCNIGIIFNF